MNEDAWNIIVEPFIRLVYIAIFTILPLYVAITKHSLDTYVALDKRVIPMKS